ncbi:hypothetical protein H4R23_003772 [Coemansia sp. Cherry 401B]|nr:hypothetical protein H4S01_005186 [Coemansia sp. RSA 2610]KAJ2727806.1 hypothetical protein H4R23_003772 [Coemansia sp. Cherry 401B]
MDYRDKDGYFQDDVLQVLGRSTLTESSAASTVLGEPAYGSLRSGNFVDAELSSTTSSSSSSSSTDLDAGADPEWEDAKRLLYTAFVGTVLPLVFRYVGRRATFSAWTRFLIGYFQTQ